MLSDKEEECFAENDILQEGKWYPKRGKEHNHNLSQDNETLTL